MLDLRLAQQVGAARVDDAIRACLAEAEVLVAHLIGSCQVPAALRERAVLECGASLYHLRAARNGIASFESDGQLTTVTVSRDPLVTARAILRPFLGVGIA